MDSLLDILYAYTKYDTYLKLLLRLLLGDDEKLLLLLSEFVEVLGLGSVELVGESVKHKQCFNISMRWYTIKDISNKITVGVLTPGPFSNTCVSSRVR